VNTDEATIPERGGPPKSRSALVVSIFAVAVAGVSVALAVSAHLKLDRHRQMAAEAQTEAARTAERLAAFESSVGAVQEQTAASQVDLDLIRTDLGSIQTALAAIDDPSDEMAEIAERVGAVEDDIASVSSDIELIGAAAAFGIEDLATCVNAYMRTVADAGGGSYTFYYC